MAAALRGSVLVQAETLKSRSWPPPSPRYQAWKASSTPSSSCARPTLACWRPSPANTAAVRAGCVRRQGVRVGGRGAQGWRGRRAPGHPPYPTNRYAGTYMYYRFNTNAELRKFQDCQSVQKLFSTWGRGGGPGGGGRAAARGALGCSARGRGWGCGRPRPRPPTRVLPPPPPVQPRPRCSRPGAEQGLQDAPHQPPQ